MLALLSDLASRFRPRRAGQVKPEVKIELRTHDYVPVQRTLPRIFA